MYFLRLQILKRLKIENIAKRTLKPEINTILILNNSKKAIFRDFFGRESHNFVNVHPVLIKFGYNNLGLQAFECTEFNLKNFPPSRSSPV